MASETIHLPTRGKDAHLGAVHFLAVLAYPLKSQTAKRDLFIETAKAWLLRERLPCPGCHEKNLLKIPKRTIYGSGPLSAAERRILQKLSQGRWLCFMMALAQVRKRKVNGHRDIALDQWLGRPAPELVDDGPVFKIDGKEPSLRRIALNMAKGSEGEAANIRGRQWRECRPIYHMIMALQQHIARKSEYDDILKLMANPAWLAPVLEHAEGIRSVSIPMMTLGIVENETIQIIPSKKAQKEICKI